LAIKTKIIKNICCQIIAEACLIKFKVNNKNKKINLAIIMEKAKITKDYATRSKFSTNNFDKSMKIKIVTK